MAQLPGTNISAGIRPNDSADVFDTHDAKYGKGGWQTGSATLADRDAITLERRAWYMVVPLGDGTKWELVPGLSSQNLADNGNWRLLTIGGPQQTITYYAATGQATDGAMTQKAVTDALALKASTTDPRFSDARTPTAHTHPAAQITDFAAAADARVLLGLNALRDGVSSQGDTLKKLYNLILGATSEVSVPNRAARDAFNVPALPFNVFVVDDGDGKWALYKATSTGVGAAFVLISDPDLLNASLSASQVKAAYESNPDTNAFTNALLAKLNGLANTVIVNALTETVAGKALDATQGRALKILLDALTARVAENEADIAQLETTVVRIDGEVDVLQQLVPANASPTNKLVTVADLSSGGAAGPTMSFTATRNVGGISAGQTVIVDSNASGQALKLILAPANPPGASLNAPNATRERGSSPAVQLNWSVSPQTNAIASIVVAGQAQTPSQVSGSVNVNTAPNTDTDFSIVVTDTQGLTASAAVRIDFQPARYFGASALTPDQVKATLQNGTNINPGALGLSKELSENKNVNQNYNCAGGKTIYVLYDSALGAPDLVRSGLLDFSAYTVEEVSIKDVFGVTRACKLLYTGIQYGSAVNLNIIS